MIKPSISLRFYIERWNKIRTLSHFLRLMTICKGFNY